MGALDQMGPHEGRVRGTITSLALLATPLWMQPWIQLAFQAAKAHCWLMSSFSKMLNTVGQMLCQMPFSPQTYWSVMEG